MSLGRVILSVVVNYEFTGDDDQDYVNAIVQEYVDMRLQELTATTMTQTLVRGDIMVKPYSIGISASPVLTVSWDK